MNWSALTTAISEYVQEDTNPSAQWTASLPVMVNNAELRIYRELDFLATRGQNSSISFTAGARTLSMAPMSGATVGGFPTLTAFPVVVQGLAAIIPSGMQPAAGTRVRFQVASKDWIDSVWPDESVTGVPVAGSAYYCMLDHETAIICPTPAAAYVAEITGTWRPAPMSTTNPETWLGDNVPDLLFKACMVEATGFQRDFGAQSDDPKMAQSWESQYQGAKQNAIEEEQRRKSQDPGWQPFQPTPLSGEPRT